uniref:Uncharacterized protein n=1 Tax=Timema monikensis TaxID=170555 RepID=A0A7R9ENC6_9NEOP|nr:unnamed protein product [Timema monikensis]
MPPLGILFSSESNRLQTKSRNSGKAPFTFPISRRSVSKTRPSSADRVILLVMTVELVTAIIVPEDKPTSPQLNKKLTYPSHTGVFHQPLVAIDKQYSTLDSHHHPGGKPLPLVHQAASSSHSHEGQATSTNQGGGHKHHKHHKGGEAEHHKHQLVANTLSCHDPE